MRYYFLYFFCFFFLFLVSVIAAPDDDYKRKKARAHQAFLQERRLRELDKKTKINIEVLKQQIASEKKERQVLSNYYSKFEKRGPEKGDVIKKEQKEKTDDQISGNQISESGLSAIETEPGVDAPPDTFQSGIESSLRSLEEKIYKIEEQIDQKMLQLKDKADQIADQVAKIDQDVLSGLKILGVG